MKSSALIESLFVAELHEGRLGSLPRPMGGKSFSENDGSVASPFPISPLFMRCLPELKGIGSCAPPKRANECSPNPDEHPLPCGTVSCLTFSLGREPSLDGLVPVSSPGFKNAVDFFSKKSLKFKFRNFEKIKNLEKLCKKLDQILRTLVEKKISNLDRFVG
jgi:hypothetical protein